MYLSGLIVHVVLCNIFMQNVSLIEVGGQMCMWICVYYYVVASYNQLYGAAGENFLYQ
jgi:hypothetical protein